VIRAYRSAPAAPAERGRDFGAANAGPVAGTVQRYEALFAALAGQPVDLAELGGEALAAIRRYAPDYAAEIEGIAEGACLPGESVAALNARTEILARLQVPQPSECSTVVLLTDPGTAPVAVQTWDWHDIFADSWLIWTIEHPGGHVVHTLTEYGILGKIGVSSAGLGLHLNILHHASDGGPVRVPVHVLARMVLDGARDPQQALALIAGAEVSASSALTMVGVDDDEPVAVTAEVFPGGPRYVLPGPDGLLVHTNHFLAPEAVAGDRENRLGPDSFLRLAVLRRRLARTLACGAPSVLACMRSHCGAGGSVCCHPVPGSRLGERYATLATVCLDPRQHCLTVKAGGPCEADPQWWSTQDNMTPLSAT
jgi:isopenicillin-N N-acyltransferase-like protein